MYLMGIFYAKQVAQNPMYIHAHPDSHIKGTPYAILLYDDNPGSICKSGKIYKYV